jgi:TRAP-type uncharacterized transport system substrate-binding protein
LDVLGRESFDFIAAHKAAEQIISNHTSYAANIDTPPSKTTTQTVDSGTSVSDWENALSQLPETSPITTASGTGFGDGDVFTVVIGGTSTGSSTQQASQALARAMSEHSDTVEVSVQVTDGWAAKLYEFDEGNIPAMGVDNNSLSKAMNEEGPFADDPVDTLPMQGFIFTSLEIHWVAMEGSGIESTADLADGGYDIYPIQPGFGTRLLTEEVIREAGLWEPNEILNVDTSDIAGAVEEGRVDALCIYGANGVALSSWVQEVDVRTGGALHVI